MTTYTKVFGGDIIPPAEYGYQALTIAASTTLVWPYNTTGGTAISKIIDLTASVASLILTLPDATQVSTGEEFLVRNVGSNSVEFQNPNGSTVATVAAGAATFFYLTNNAVVNGTYGTISYGVGTSVIDAATLVGYGIIASGSSLNQAHPVVGSASGFTLDATYRAKMVNYTGGSGTLALTAAATLGDNFFTLVRNSGTGTLAIDPNGAETIDGSATLDVQPGESLLLFCSGTAWYSVGYGRSVVFNFTQLVLDVSAAGTFTLSSSQAANKLLAFTGNPASAVTVVVPNTVAVYYLLSSISTAQNITVKTAAGTGTVVPQTQRIIAICDSTNVYSAQSVSASTSVSLIDGSAASPALNFSSKTNTGVFKYSTHGVGLTANGAEVAHFDTGDNQVTGPLTLTGTSAALTVTGGSVTASTPVVNSTQTWNSGAVTFSGWKLNVTDTASAAASLLADLQVGGSSKFSVSKGGAVTSAGALTVSSGGAAITGNSTITGTLTTTDVITTAKGSTGVLINQITNTTAGTTAQARWRAVNDLGSNHAASFGISSASLTPVGTMYTADQAYALADVQAAGGMLLGSAGSGPLTFGINNTAVGVWTGSLLTANTNASVSGTLGVNGTLTSNSGSLIANNTSAGASSFLLFRDNGSAKYNIERDGSNNLKFNYNESGGTTIATLSTTGATITGTLSGTSSILSSGATAGIGYTTGAGGTVTQATSRTTGVTLNKVTGAITLVSAAGSATPQSFTVTNSAVAATDVVAVSQKSGTDKYVVLVTAVAAGSFQVTFYTTGGTTTEQPVFNFAVIKGSAS